MDHQDWKPVILHNPKKKPIVEKNKVVAKTTRAALKLAKKASS